MKRTAKAILHKGGALHAVRAANARKLRILMYHRFTPATEDLARQCEYIRRYYHPVALDDVGRSLAAGEPLPANSIVVTVDDGYRDFYLYAAPVFRKYAIPATVYLVSDFIDGKLWLWVDQVRYLIEHTQVPGYRTLPLATPDERSRAILTLYDHLNTVPDGERLRTLAAMPGELEVSLPGNPPDDFTPMSWSEIRGLAHNGVTFGAHTRTHPILSRVGSTEKLHTEIAGSKARIEQELGAPVEHFCYPNGTSRDISADSVRILHESGFSTAVTTEPGLNPAGADPYLLHRQGVDPWVASDYFAELLAGIRGHR